jgi:hypothetical protein
MLTVGEIGRCHDIMDFTDLLCQVGQVIRTAEGIEKY